MPKAGNGNVLRVFFFYTWVRFAREGKAVALQYHEQGSTDTNVCGGFAVVRSLSVDEHKHSPARIRYSNKVLYICSELHTGSALMFCRLLAAKLPQILNSLHWG